MQLPSWPLNGEISAFVLRQIILNCASSYLPLVSSSRNRLMAIKSFFGVFEIASSISPVPSGKNIEVLMKKVGESHEFWRDGHANLLSVGWIRRLYAEPYLHRRIQLRCVFA
ncbi:hypothetical protein [Methylocystis echinoides]|uniref:hypothetical protein n=1 Tax=Methylocystis echinoides TaxID=29468 RepID=UPI0024920373|nr:hypothetical protein [Methylocystis echinoides]